MKSSNLKTIKVPHGKITVGLHYTEGNDDAYFTLTAWFKEGRDEWGGACHDEILKLRPDLKPFADLHLSDTAGVPMHLIGNAMYHAGRGKYSGYAPRHLAAHLRISNEAADYLADYGTKNDIATFCIDQLPRYAAEARAAIQLLESL